jgi:hypothetical protein
MGIIFLKKGNLILSDQLELGESFPLPNFKDILFLYRVRVQSNYPVMREPEKVAGYGLPVRLSMTFS